MSCGAGFGIMPCFIAQHTPPAIAASTAMTPTTPRTISSVVSSSSTAGAEGEVVAVSVGDGVTATEVGAEVDGVAVGSRALAVGTKSAPAAREAAVIADTRDFFTLLIISQLFESSYYAPTKRLIRERYARTVRSTSSTATDSSWLCSSPSTDPNVSPRPCRANP